MDDLRAFIAPFDADAELTPAPDPWEYLPMPSVRPAAPWAMHEMVAAEPGLVARIGRRLVADGSAAALAASIRRVAEAGGPVVVTGCGTSEHASMGVAAILREGWRAADLAGWGPVSQQAFELSLEPPADGLVIGISHEGGTAATLAAMEAGRGMGCDTAAITASPGSPAASAGDVVLATIEMDRSWCHTVGYLSPLAAAAVTADMLAGRVPQPGALAARVQAGIEAAWRVNGADAGRRTAEAIGALVVDAANLLVVASGADRITARELVLKVEEAAYVPSAVRDLETFLHGHLPSTDESTALIVILTEATHHDARAKRARQALAAAAATGMVPAAILSTTAAAQIPEALTPGGRIVVPDPDASEELSGVVASLLGAAGPLQLVTLGVAAGRGTNPDPIRRDDAVYLRAADLADDSSI